MDPAPGSLNLEDVGKVKIFPLRPGCPGGEVMLGPSFPVVIAGA